MEFFAGVKSAIILPLRTRSAHAKRIFEIDLLRGVMIILMVLDHIAYDFGFLGPDLFDMVGAPQWLASFSSWCTQYWNFSWRVNMRYTILALFFALSGLSAYLSRNSLKRGLILIGFGAIISVVFYCLSLILETNMFIFFGIISSFGVALIAYSSLRWLVVKATGKRGAWKWFALFFAALFLICGYWMRVSISSRSMTSDNWWVIINSGYREIIPTFHIVDGIFTPIHFGAGTKLAIILGQLWYGVDWSGIFPYIGYVFLGGFIGETAYAKKKSIVIDDGSAHVAGVGRTIEKIFRPLTYVGSKTLYVYLFHQIVVGAATILVFLLAGLAFK